MQTKHQAALDDDTGNGGKQATAVLLTAPIHGGARVARTMACERKRCCRFDP